MGKIIKLQNTKITCDKFKKKNIFAYQKMMKPQVKDNERKRCETP